MTAITVDGVTASLIGTTHMEGGTNPGIGSHYGCSYYMGVEVTNGDKNITIKPIRLWRDGENQNNDNPANHYRIEGIVVGNEVTEVTLVNGLDVVEVIEVDFGDGTSRILKTMKFSEFLSGRAAIFQKISEDMEKRNPGGYNYFVVFDENLEHVPHDLREKAQGALYIQTTECTYGTCRKVAVYKVAPDMTTSCLVIKKSPGHDCGTVHGSLCKEGEKIIFSGASYWPTRLDREFSVEL